MMWTEIRAKTILNKKKKADEWFLDEYTLNPYSACSFNCLYCYIRGSKYGFHMEEKLAVKVNAPELLEKQLKLLSRKNKYGVIVLASATDPYLQAEKDTLLTKTLLEIIRTYRFPVHVITKSDLVIRDFDILRQIDQNAIVPSSLEGKTSRGAFLTFSFSTLDPAVTHIFEPGATLPSLRLAALARASAEGFHTGVSLMPLLPYISDTDKSLQEMTRAFAEAGAKYVMPASLGLFGNGPADSKALMLRAVAKHFPHLLENYYTLFNSDGRAAHEYRSRLAERIKGLQTALNLPDRIVS